LTGSLVLSAIGVGLLVWWFFSGTRSWLVLCVALVVAFAGVVIAARARRTPSASNASFERDSKGP
jgi:uncharacterized protein involved in exopolysaccharide biosynthesis